MSQRHHPGQGSILLDMFSLSVLHLDTHHQNWIEEDLSQAGDRLAHTEPYLKAGARADTFLGKGICEAFSSHQCVLKTMLASDGLTLSGGRRTRPTVTADSHRVDVEGVDARSTVRQLDNHLLRLVVGTDSVMGFNVGRFQDGFLSPQVENRKPVRMQHPASYSWSHPLLVVYFCSDFSHRE